MDEALVEIWNKLRAAMDEVETGLPSVPPNDDGTGVWWKLRHVMNDVEQHLGFVPSDKDHGVHADDTGSDGPGPKHPPKPIGN